MDELVQNPAESQIQMQSRSLLWFLFLLSRHECQITTLISKGCLNTIGDKVIPYGFFFGGGELFSVIIRRTLRTLQHKISGGINDCNVMIL